LKQAWEATTLLLEFAKLFSALKKLSLFRAGSEMTLPFFIRFLISSMKVQWLTRSQI
jgi:hypothetical protein